MSSASESAPVKRRRLVVLLPLLFFLALAALFLFRLGAGDPSKLPSALIGRPVSERAMEMVYRVGFLMVIGFMGFVFWNDLFGC